MRYALIASPLGDLLAVRDDDGITGLYLPTGKRPMRPAPHWRRSDSDLADVAEQLGQYFAGERREFDLTLRPHGTGFQRRVWDALLEIPYGETRSYGSIAAELGVPGAARAVGLANGQNPISIIVPCHRVVGASGALTGYGGGLPAKQWLLSHEAARVGLFAG
jgi:methylated-DNA-[protein]-cysteine S-methyltransferase